MSAAIRCWTGCLAIIVLTVGASAEETGSAAMEEERFFETFVRPVLVNHCSECHGSEKQFAGLRLDSWTSIAEESDTAPVVISGDPDASLLIRAIRREGGLDMPPDDPLDEKSVEVLTHWVRNGAYWPTSAAIDDDRKPVQGHWAFQPIVSPEIPSLPSGSSRFARQWPRTTIDAFVIDKLQSQELLPAREADRRTLIRRASYAVTGLPPSSDAIERFVEDPAPDAYARLVDRLLASPQYGEHWARKWLDIARYSDSKGYVYAREERFWTHAWSYRDWVVNAFNEDRPYDEFLLMQLAADQVASSQQDLAAMGYLTLGRRFLGVKHDIIDDRIDVLTRGMLGLTVACARCHDHKFDPIPTADYYSLYGVFDSCLEREQSISDINTLDPAYVAELDKRQQAYDSRMSQVRQECADRVRQRITDYLAAQFELDEYPDESFGQLFQKSDLLPTVVHRWKEYLRDAQEQNDPVFYAWHRFAPLADLSEAEFIAQSQLISAELQNAAADQVHPLVAKAFVDPPQSISEMVEIHGKLFSAPEQDLDAALIAVRQGSNSPCEIPPGSIVEIELMMDIDSTQELWGLQAQVDRWIIQAEENDQRVRILIDRTTPVQPRVFRRGNPLRKQDAVSRHFLSLFSSEPPEPFSRGSGRLELAQRIIEPGNPLTARVIVNRVWGQYFGHPLVATPSDFGLRASPPSHPELLDSLATALIENHWSLKELHRRILLSATFRQSDQGCEDLTVRPAARRLDPENRWLWHWQPQRLTLEEMRDSFLSVTDDLDSRIGGKPVDTLWKSPFSQRRAIYGVVDRQFLPGLLRAFDFANPDLSIATRSETTVPQQSLFFLNHPLVLERARAISASVEAIASPDDRVEALFQTVLLRPPTPSERSDALHFVTSTDPHTQGDVPPTASDWSYGYGKLDEASSVVKHFTELPHFSGQAWQGGPAYPDPALGWVQLNESGGHPGNDRTHAAVRRWTAPHDMHIQIQSEIMHEPPQGDGIRAFIVTSSVPAGVVSQATVHQKSAKMNVDALLVAAGQTVDFLVDIGDNLGYDQFSWEIVVSEKGDDGTSSSHPANLVWDAKADFGTVNSEPLSAWEQLTQILLGTNEFLFVH
ncbi:PSD1 and planctomycete cytochrome C domain-containing protein [Allorhodopirellula heiligendammensis]|uniref:Planctomycete cytochrome C n=1 Tax=Allorhodopirellula heiligendammensis TaxID=2714739 RepID=A0A5C6C8F8_9BACT|nr:PSD1 and planctomycete cytochrome C domain-containing protein [Allorhodopirellula heiligendammensis]TWU19039.1 Planctomycete cytochrome C [Allorhodopirellula heiligendammensis]